MSRNTNSGVVIGFTPAVLDKLQSPDVGLVVWRRMTRLNLQITAASLRLWPPFTKIAVGTPETAARMLFRELSVFNWPLYADIRRLGRRFVAITGCEIVRMQLEHVADDGCSPFHIDAVELLLLCTYSGAGIEWIGEDGQIRHTRMMEVAVFKGDGFPVPGPRIPHRWPALRHLPSSQRFRLVLSIYEALGHQIG